MRDQGRFSDDVIRAEAVRQVREAPTDQPLFSWVSFGAPHVCEAVGEQCYTPEVMRRDQGAEACSSLAPFKPPPYTTRTNPREVRAMPPWPRGWRLREVCESLLVVDRAVGQLWQPRPSAAARRSSSSSPTTACPGARRASR